MILGQISYLDCLVFVTFLAPQLLFRVGVWATLKVAIQASPFLGVLLPIGFIRDRFFTRRERQTPFVQQASLFQDFVIRCVRYAFANIPATVGKVFFSKEVALPFFYFRMLRHGYLRTTIPWQEVDQKGAKGLWLITDESEKPDVVVYYCHGGGFSMGSSYFYLEFLLAWVALLKASGFRNPALFALEYDLAPDTVYPTQLQQTLRGYDYALSKVQDSSKICVGGDSAGATLILSMLLQKSMDSNDRRAFPGLATMISPWVTLVSVRNQDTPSDYLNADSLHLYGSQYAGPMASLDDPLVSPGKCKDVEWWKRASPLHGWSFFYGSEEVFAPETRDLIKLLKRADVDVNVHEEKGSIHAWPVASLFLGRNRDERQHGLRNIVKVTRNSIGTGIHGQQNGSAEKLVPPLREKTH